jgi:hypothetical protein
MRMVGVVAHALLRVMSSSDAAEEAARNVVQALVDGETVRVFDHVLDVLRSPTRAAALTTTLDRALRIAAVEATVDYADAVSTWGSQLERWAFLTRVVGVPEDVLRVLELERRAARGEVAA